MKNGRSVMDEVLRRRARSPRDVIAWDLDGTLLDPRPRMLATVRAFGKRAQLGDMRPSWQDTAAALGLDEELFGPFWHEHFWSDDAFMADTPIASTLRFARAAARRGLAPLIITGRVSALRTSTWAQLVRVGLSDAALVMKPQVRRRTPAWKAQVIARHIERGTRVAAFVTDSADEIEHARACVRGLVCVLVSHDAVDAGVPVWRVRR